MGSIEYGRLAELGRRFEMTATTKMPPNVSEIAKLAAVARVSEWKDRWYVTLANTNPRANGDSRKIWIKGDVLTADPYKGYMSDGAIASLDHVETRATELGMTVREL